MNICLDEKEIGELKKKMQKYISNKYFLPPKEKAGYSFTDDNPSPTMIKKKSIQYQQNEKVNKISLIGSKQQNNTTKKRRLSNLSRSQSPSPSRSTKKKENSNKSKIKNSQMPNGYYLNRKGKLCRGQSDRVQTQSYAPSEGDSFYSKEPSVITKKMTNSKKILRNDEIDSRKSTLGILPIKESLVDQFQTPRQNKNSDAERKINVKEMAKLFGKQSYQQKSVHNHFPTYLEITPEHQNEESVISFGDNEMKNQRKGRNRKFLMNESQQKQRKRSKTFQDENTQDLSKQRRSKVGQPAKQQNRRDSMHSFKSRKFTIKVESEFDNRSSSGSKEGGFLRRWDTHDFQKEKGKRNDDRGKEMNQPKILIHHTESSSGSPLRQTHYNYEQDQYVNEELKQKYSKLTLRLQMLKEKVKNQNKQLQKNKSLKKNLNSEISQALYLYEKYSPLKKYQQFNRKNIESRRKRDKEQWKSQSSRNKLYQEGLRSGSPSPSNKKHKRKGKISNAF